MWELLRVHLQMLMMMLRLWETESMLVQVLVQVGSRVMKVWALVVVAARAAVFSGKPLPDPCPDSCRAFDKYGTELKPPQNMVPFSTSP